MKSKISEFDFDFAKKSKIEQRRFFRKLKIAKSKIEREIKSNYYSKLELKAIQR